MERTIGIFCGKSVKGNVGFIGVNGVDFASLMKMVAWALGVYPSSIWLYLPSKGGI